jgi:hypothetical protein
MFAKTIAILDSLKRATFYPDDVSTYDLDELNVLGRILQRMVYTPSSLRKVLQDKFDVTITRADFYSEIPTISEIERSYATESLLKLDAIFPDNAIMLAELQVLTDMSVEFDPPLHSDRLGEFSWMGGQFSFADAMAYYAMIRTRKPKTIIEVGSGWSTLVAQMAVARNGVGNIICIEPYPNAFLADIPGITLIQKRIQEVDTAFFAQNLADGDFLFIDSTHTVKHDSDCLHLYLRILPAIQADIVVHVHDIHLPDPLPIARMRDQHIFWNEQYLLYAYLLNNTRVRTLYGTKYHYTKNRPALDRLMHGRVEPIGGSFWFEQTKGSALT